MATAGTPNGMNPVSDPETLKPPDMGDVANQPSNSAIQWFSNWRWLHYNSSQDCSFCYTCVRAVSVGKLSLRLETQLGVMFSSTTEKLNPTLEVVKNQVSTISPVQQTSLSEIRTLLKLIYVTPATNAVGERSASILCRVKAYLRSTMSQMHMNNIMILQAHNERTDALSITSCLNEFVSLRNKHRLEVFGKF